MQRLDNRVEEFYNQTRNAMICDAASGLLFLKEAAGNGDSLLPPRAHHEVAITIIEAP